MTKYTLTISFDTAEELAAYVAGGYAPAAAPAPAADTKKADKPAAETKKTPPAKAKPEHTREELFSALTQVKDKLGLSEAKKLIKEVGGVETKADIPDEKIDSVFAACEKAIADADEAM